MTSASSVDTAVQDYLDSGLRSLWYPVAASWEVGSNPVGITRLGENLVLWRGFDGTLHAVEDRCPHRGARLSKGWNLGDRLACWYHGVEVNGEGEVCDVPAISNSPLVGQACVRRYPIQEAHGAIFVYFGTSPYEEPGELELPEQLTRDLRPLLVHRHLEVQLPPSTTSWTRCTAPTCTRTRTPWPRVIVRRRWCSSPPRAASSSRRPARPGSTSTGWSSATPMPCGCACRSPTSSASARAARSGSSAWRCPRTRSTPGCSSGGCARWTAGQVWRFFYRTKLEQLHWDVLEQDRIILENLAPEARTHENLYQHDVGLSRLRRVMLKMAKKQLAERQQAA